MILEQREIIIKALEYKEKNLIDKKIEEHKLDIDYRLC
jgi:hypothetical protein